MLNAHRVRLLAELHDRGAIRAVAGALHCTLAQRAADPPSATVRAARDELPAA
jgi:hypothetical protein